jgi:hypothetical protein
VPGPGQSAGTIKTKADTPLFASARTKRVLALDYVNTAEGQVLMPAAALPTVTGFKTLQMMTKPAIADMAIAPGGYYYGGHDFNQYTIVQAEENIYGAPDGNSLLQVYDGSVKKILGEWDASARMIESRSNINGDSNPDSNVEYINLPGQTGEPVRLRPDYVFRFASTPRKETLNVYVLKNEIRVHRMVWGERNVDITKVKLDSDQAMKMAQEAFASRSASPGYPVYPESQYINKEMEVLYSIPETANWQMNLNQVENNSLRYYVNANFQIRNLQAPSNPDNAVSNDPAAPRMMPPPDMYYVSGSLEIDAVTGKILNLNRPVIYRPMYEGIAYPATGGGISAGVAPAPVELMSEPASK